jgi:hypothetical protein
MSRRVSCIPSTDQGLERAARAALAVHRQTELARIDGEDVWYVYRDGRPHHGSEGDPN